MYPLKRVHSATASTPLVVVVVVVVVVISNNRGVKLQTPRHDSDVIYKPSIYRSHKRPLSRWCPSKEMCIFTYLCQPIKLNNSYLLLVRSVACSHLPSAPCVETVSHCPEALRTVQESHPAVVGMVVTSWVVFRQVHSVFISCSLDLFSSSSTFLLSHQVRKQTNERSCKKLSSPSFRILWSRFW